MVNNKNSSYSKGKRCGFAVAKSSLKTSKSNVHKVDKAMKTCSQIARTGTKKLNQNERNAYRGIADGIYDAIKSEEKTQNHKPQQKKKPLGKPRRAKRNRYRVDTYVEDGVYNDRFFVTSFHPSLKEARAEAIKEEKYQKNQVDHSMVNIYSTISSNRKRYKMKK